MYRTKYLALVCAIALAAGCTQNKQTAQRQSLPPQSEITESTGAEADAAASATAAPTTAPSAAAPAVETDKLAGAWQLAIPRKSPQTASIAATDGSRVTIAAGENLSGQYLVQGRYLLMLSNDERLRPIAWRINSPDSITVVRTADLGAEATDYTGVTLIRAAATEAPAENKTASTESNTQ